MNEEEWNIQQKAIYNAVNAFRETFEKEDYDSSYWSIRVEVRRLGRDWAIIDRSTFDDLQERLEEGD